MVSPAKSTLQLPSNTTDAGNTESSLITDEDVIIRPNYLTLSAPLATDTLNDGDPQTIAIADPLGNIGRFLNGQFIHIVSPPTTNPQVRAIFQLTADGTGASLQANFQANGSDWTSLTPLPTGSYVLGHVLPPAAPANVRGATVRVSVGLQVWSQLYSDNPTEQAQAAIAISKAFHYSVNPAAGGINLAAQSSSTAGDKQVLELSASEASTFQGLFNLYPDLMPGYLVWNYKRAA